MLPCVTLSHLTLQQPSTKANQATEGAALEEDDSKRVGGERPVIIRLCRDPRGRDGMGRVMSQGRGDGVGQGDDSIDGGERALAWWLTDWGVCRKAGLASTSLVFLK